ncbi:MAG: hypothetical protein Q9170_006522 [Blastenia crenularia]
MSSAEPETNAQLLAKLQAMTLAKEEVDAQLKQEKRQNEERALQLEQATKLNRPTTLHELLEFCHTFIDQRFVVETDPAKTSRGGLTNPTGKHCPLFLEPWDDFEAHQAAAFEAVEAELHPAGSDPVRAFEPLLFIQKLGNGWKKKIASEPDLGSFQNQMVERFVDSISSSLSSAVTFANTSHALGQDSGSPVEPASTYNAKVEKKLPPVPQPTGADQLCVFRGKDDITELLLIQEYKAPHKLTKEVLRAALREQNTMDVTEVRNGEKIPQDPTAKFLNGAQTLICMAAAQTYEYMLRGGCTHGCIVTGESIVFVRIKEEDTTTLLYHFTEPILDAANGSRGFHPSKTTVAQLVSFCSMAFGSPARSQEWIQAATEKAPVWKVDHDQFWMETPEKVRELRKKADRADTTYHAPKAPPSDREPYPTRQQSKARKPSDGCKTPTKGGRNDRDDPDQDEKRHDNMGSPRKSSTMQTYREHGGQQASRVWGAAPKQQQRQYCTQACILGLARSHTIDESCPNASRHPRGKRGDTHSLTKPVLRYLLRQQLARTMDDHCQNLSLSGARGMLFKLSLAEHGYTFVGKATIDRYVPYLQHEGRIYDRLRKLQGQSIPVCLGNIDLATPWYGIGGTLVHMLLMSYGGEYLTFDETTSDRLQQAADFETTIAAMGVRHEDMRSRNMLWHQETGRLLFIDFERSTTFEVPTESPKVELPKVESPKPNIQPKPPKRKTAVKRKAFQELSPFHVKLNRPAATPKKPAVLLTKDYSSPPKTQFQEAPKEEVLDQETFIPQTTST